VLIEKLLKVALLGSTWVMYLLLLLSVVSITTMIERWVFFRRRSDDVDELGEQLIALLQRGDRQGAAERLKKSRSVEAAVLLPALRYLDGSPDAIEDAVQSQMLRERRDMERGMTYMGTLGNNAPFIGLFGTVIGVIIAFQQLGTSQAAASMSAVMGGIAEALVATGVGLFVALPAVVAYNLVQKTIADIEDNVTAITKDITALLKSGQLPAAGVATRKSVDVHPRTHAAENQAVGTAASLHDLAPRPGN
jgi:biopolymer transport protein ExbB/biopolymer transport protein TolQ